MPNPVAARAARPEKRMRTPGSSEGSAVTSPAWSARAEKTARNQTKKENTTWATNPF